MSASLQLVVPCYNEAGRLKLDLFLQLPATGFDIGLLFVDDGSTDATSAILADMAARSDGRTLDAFGRRSAPTSCLAAFGVSFSEEQAARATTLVPRAATPHEGAHPSCTSDHHSRRPPRTHPRAARAAGRLGNTTSRDHVGSLLCAVAGLLDGGGSRRGLASC